MTPCRAGISAVTRRARAVVEAGGAGGAEALDQLLLHQPFARVQAAEDDVGAVLGWEGLMTRAVQGGRLVALVPEGIPSPVAFSLRLNPRASAKARLFADWLVQSA